MDERINCAIETLDLKGNAAEEPLYRTVYVPFFSNSVKHKQEKQGMHTYNLIEAKSFYGSEKMKQRDDRHYQMIS